VQQTTALIAVCLDSGATPPASARTSTSRCALPISAVCVLLLLRGGAGMMALRPTLVRFIEREGLNGG
jgi:hypothetical protein